MYYIYFYTGSVCLLVKVFTSPIQCFHRLLIAALATSYLLAANIFGQTNCHLPLQWLGYYIRIMYKCFHNNFIIQHSSISGHYKLQATF